MRRYDVDSIRIIALILLIFYHISISFQTWALEISFIKNKDSLELLWLFMMLINIWRIPILFIVSGMGVYFAMERRNWKELLDDRTLRIITPLIFGSIFIFPICPIIFNLYYKKPIFYFPFPGHLWFLINIYFYVLIFLPFFNYLKNNPNNLVSNFLIFITKFPLGIIFILGLPMVIGTILINPKDFPAFAFTTHGFIIGFICFFNGFLLISIKKYFWDSITKIRFQTLFIAITLYIIRLTNLINIESQNEPLISSILIINILTAFEATNWILSILGFSAIYLNKPSKLLTYLSSSVYTVYIVHMPIQFLFSTLIFPLNINTSLKLILLLLATYSMSFLIFEIIKNIKYLRVLFGMKNKTLK